MEAMRAASAALASTSGPSAGPSEQALSVKLSAASANGTGEQDVLFGLPKVKPHHHRQHQCRLEAANAVARDVGNLNGSTKVNWTKVEGPPKLVGKKIDVPSVELEKIRPINKAIAALAAAILEMEKRKKVERTVESFGKGKLVENDFVYRQMFVIRSYEVGFDRTASIETLTNLFQECALNHVGMSDFVGDGMGTTHAMMRHRLIWVVTRMQIQVERYPIWGDAVEIDTWVAGEGKNGMRRDWLVTDYNSGEILARATSTWVTMNQDTRRLSKMPDDVRKEISPYFLERWILKEEPCRRIKKLGDDAQYIRSDLVVSSNTEAVKPRLNDMDMNQHVNNVKYIGWVLESVPQSVSVAHELTSMVLEYKRECSPSDIVQSMTSPDFVSKTRFTESEDSNISSKCPLLDNGALDGSPGAVSCSSGALKLAVDSQSGPLHYTHLLRLQCDGAEIVRGRTVWRLKKRYVKG